MVYKPTQRRALKDATRKMKSKKIQNPGKYALAIALCIAFMTFALLRFTGGL